MFADDGISHHDSQGEGELTNLGENGEDHAVHKQRFLTIWKKVNGQWKVAHDMAVNTTPWQ